MITFEEYRNLTKIEIKNILKEVNIKELNKEERELYYLMNEGLSIEAIKSVMKSNYEKMVTPPVIFE